MNIFTEKFRGFVISVFEHNTSIRAIWRSSFGERGELKPQAAETVPAAFALIRSMVNAMYVYESNRVVKLMVDAGDLDAAMKV